MNTTARILLLIHVISIGCQLVIGMSIGTTFWVEDEASTGQLYRPSLLTSNTDSLVGCLTICSSTVKYKGSTYNTETRECNCLDGNVSVTSHPGNRLWNRQFKGFLNLQLGWYIKLFANIQMPQSQAETFCGTLGARLAILDTNEKVDYVTALPDYPADRFVFVGATDQATERMFLWSNGANANHIRWGHGDPNDAFPGEDCVALHNSYFVDLSCSHQGNFACEMI